MITEQQIADELRRRQHAAWVKSEREFFQQKAAEKEQIRKELEAREAGEQEQKEQQQSPQPTSIAVDLRNADGSGFMRQTVTADSGFAFHLPDPPTGKRWSIHFHAATRPNELRVAFIPVIDWAGGFILDIAPPVPPPTP